MSGPASQENPPKAKRRRWPWLVVGFLGGSGVVAGLLFAPPVQGWLLRRMIATQPGWRVNFETFGIAPTGVQARGLEFAMPGLQAQAEPLAVRIAPGRLLTKRELQIERVEAQKVRVTITPAQLASGDSAEPFTGLLTLLQAPLPWLLDEARIDGEIAVRDGDTAVVVGSFKLEGGQLSATTPGEFTYELTVNSALLPLGPDNKVRSRGTIRLTQNRRYGVAKIEIAGDLTLPRYGALALPAGRFSFAVVATEKGEEYRGDVKLGTAVAGELHAALDAAAKRLGGRLTLGVEEGDLLSATLGSPLPHVTATSSVDFEIGLDANTLRADAGGEFDVRDLGRLQPELAGVDAFKGRFGAKFGKAGDAIVAQHFSFELAANRAEPDRPTIRLDSLAPVNVTALSSSSPLAKLVLAHLPIAWANPWLVAAGVQLEPAEFGGEWQVTLADKRKLVLSPARACVIEPVIFTPSPLPPGRFAFSPRIELSETGVTLDVPDFLAESKAGERMMARLAANYDFASGAVGSHGHFEGVVPTVPFVVAADWIAKLAGQTLALNEFSLEARAPDATNPAVRLALLQPTTIDLEKLTVPVASGGAELMRLSFDRLPLGWISRWSGDVAIDGTLVGGVSVLRADAEGKLTFSTQAPWTIDDAGLTVGGRQLAQGRMRFAPRAEFAENRVAATLAEFSAEDQAGNRVAGDVELSAEIAERKVTAALTLAASLPALPHSEGTFGALDADIRAKAHNETDKIVVMDELAVQVRSAGRELFAVEAPQPFLFGFSNSGMFTVGTIAPLALRTGEIPLAWLRPWSGGLELEGTLQPAEFVAAAQLTKFQVRPVKPVHVRDLAARWEDRDLVRETEFSFHPGLDLTLICIPLPEFQLALSGTAHVTRGALEIAGRHALDLDAAFSFLGNDRALLPSGIELTTRVELAALRDTPALAGRGLPTHGTIVARMNGDMLGNEPIEFWTRVDGVPAADGSRVLPALEIGAQGKVSLTQSFTADVAVQLETTPRPTEAKFELGLNLREGNLEIASAFRSAFLDAGEALEMLRAFQPRTTEPVEDPDGATPRAEGGSRYAQLGVPFWSTLRGHFDLDIGTLQFAPYRIERVGGRLELRDRELELSHLSGSMFAGRWGGRVRIDYQPENQAGDHALAGEFRIEQFDSARVVQTVFPEELSTLDAKIDVRSTVRSRGNALVELIERTEGEFTAEGSGGVVRLKVPKQELAATAAVFGGTILLSPELRALGRLLKKFAEMPVDQIRLSGQRTATGEVELSELRIDSPQARLSARGRIPAVPGEPLMNRPLELSIDLAARDEMAVILGGMSLIEKKPGADGYRPLRETFVLGGKAGEPDTRPLYDLLAKAVVGSKGTWGFLMRQVQNQVNKLKPAKPGGGKS